MSDDTERIKERLDLADFIGEYVQLKKNGGHHKGLCPFHQEKTPSFVVSPDKGIWHCFGCGEGGDAFSFLQKIEGVEFPEALKQLAERAGVEISQRPVGQNQDVRASYFELMALAAKFYQEILVNLSAGQKAKKYLLERGLTDQAIKDFNIGYAPMQWDTVQQFLMKKGYSLQQLMAVGLVGRSEGGKAYDRFRGRIMFPINDVQGRVVAFGGRITPWHATGSEGKYINSPETEIYTKRKVVYNLDKAKKSLHKKDPCLVVEGYMDVVMLAQSGYHNVVASSGTAFTSEQVALLKRYTQILHFAFDSDAAGVKAAQSATTEALQAGLNVATVALPFGQDPADIALLGKDALDKLFKTPISITSFLLKRLQDAQASADRDDILKGILPFVAQVANPILQGEMVRDIAVSLGVPENSINQQLAQVEQIKETTETLPEAQGASSDITGEHLLMGLLIQHPSARETFFADISDGMLSNKKIIELHEYLKKMAKDKQFATLSTEQILANMPAEQLSLAEIINRLTNDELDMSGDSPEQFAQRLVHRLQTRALKNKLKALQQQLHTGNTEDQEALLKRFQETAVELTSLETTG